MNLVEIRVLEGPNYFLHEPAIKIEFDSGTGTVGDQDLEAGRHLLGIVQAAHEAAGLPSPHALVEALETPGHLGIVFGWSRRRFATRLAEIVAAGGDPQAASEELVALAREPATPDDLPDLVTDNERTRLAIGVTGTNGKTTTTRLISHIFNQSGRRAGWSCSSGVYIAGEEVLAGDYSGPQGALRVLREPGVDVAVMELARGGILRRGIATQSLDVSVFTNISGDHLDLQGIHTVAGLARTKAVVSRITRPEGFAVVNADDDLVMEATENVAAKRVPVSQDPENPRLVTHIASGGIALVHEGELLMAYQNNDPQPLARVDEIPMTYNGAAGFMIENALCASAACWSAGLSLDDVRKGLLTFVNSSEQNPGRLNVFDLHGVAVIVDFAHNEAGLLVLLNFARSLIGESGSVYSVVGTAGDRTDSSIRELGKIAATWSDHIIAKDTVKYLRGRDSEELLGLYASGASEVGGATYEEAPGELDAVRLAVERAAAGDAVAIMGHEDAPAICSFLLQNGARPV